MKYIKATYTIDVEAIIPLDDRLQTLAELNKARVYEHAQANAVYPLRKELEKRMAELTRNDIKFELIDDEDCKCPRGMKYHSFSCPGKEGELRCK